MAIDETAGYLTMKQAAAIYGVSVTSIWRWCQNGTLPTVRLGGVVRIPANAIIRPEPVEEQIRRIVDSTPMTDEQVEAVVGIIRADRQAAK